MTLRADIIRSSGVAAKRAKKKKKKRLKSAGLLGDIWDKVTGKKKDRADRIGDILDEDPYAPDEDDESEDS